MLRRTRAARITEAVQRVLTEQESVEARGVCWAAARRPRVPLLVLGRHRYDAVLTNQRLLLIARRRYRLEPGDVALVKRFSALTMERRRAGFPLLQQLVTTESGAHLVLEWPLRSRTLGRALDDALDAAPDPTPQPAPDPAPDDAPDAAPDAALASGGE